MTTNAEAAQAAADAAVANLKKALIAEAGIQKKELFARIEKIELDMANYWAELGATQKMVHELAKRFTDSP